MKNDRFRKNFAALLKKAGDKADMVVRASALAVGSSIVQRSPVDTGRFKGNWQYGNTSINFGSSSAADASGASAIGRIAQGLPTWKAGQTIYITNSLPYAKRLEYGWSRQAPGGMVRLAVAEWKDTVRRQAEALKNV